MVSRSATLAAPDGKERKETTLKTESVPAEIEGFDDWNIDDDGEGGGLENMDYDDDDLDDQVWTAGSIQSLTHDAAQYSWLLA
jgi:hypothetical protein